MIRRIPIARKRTPRRGAMYGMVLLSSLLVGVVSLSAIAIGRAKLKTRALSESAVDADTLAHAALERALKMIKLDANWRTTYTSNVEAESISFGGGTISFKLVDADGDLSDDATDAVDLYGIARVGDAAIAHRVTLSSAGSPIESLDAAVHAGDTFSVIFSAVAGDYRISTNSNFSASLSNVYPEVRAVSSVSGGTYHGGSSVGNPVWQMPDAASVFTHYQGIGTTIAITDIPKVSGKRTIRHVVISPASNPYGATNADGIYVINCAGNDLFIKDCRIEGTLVILNPGSNSAVQQSVHWAPAGNFPALLVDGSLIFDMARDLALSEGATGTNFNPAGTPYQGNSDSDTADTYPSEINGLVYIADHLTSSGKTKVNGAVLVDKSVTLSSSDDVFNHDAALMSNPPAEFTGTGGAGTEFTPGTAARGTLP